MRHGTATLFAAFDIASGFVIDKCYKRRLAVEYLKFLKKIDAQIPEGSLSTSSWTTTRPTRHPRSKRGSLAGRTICPLHADFRVMDQSDRALVRGTHQKADPARCSHLRQAARGRHPWFIELHNNNPKPFKWTKFADQILAPVKRLCHKAQQTLCGEL